MLLDLRGYGNIILASFPYNIGIFYGFSINRLCNVYKQKVMSRSDKMYSFALNRYIPSCRTVAKHGLRHGGVDQSLVY